MRYRCKRCQGYLTKRWSEPPPAVHHVFRSSNIFTAIQPRPSAAVAHLRFVRSMLRATLLILLLVGTTTAPGRVSDDKAAIRATVTDYIEGYYLNDAARMERSLHPRYLKHTISGSDGQLNIIEKRGTDMVREARNKKEVTPASQRKKEISIFAVDGDVAS